jgi:NADPH:quinone reductase-like Zn-dependent oxidoreductase
MSSARPADVVDLDAALGERLLHIPVRQSYRSVLIDVRAAGVGNWDELARIGTWQIGGPPPMALGVVASGIVTAIGEDFGWLAVGDEVLVHTLPLKRNGTWAERVLAPVAAVAPKPASADFELAAAFPVPALTA